MKIDYEMDPDGDLCICVGGPAHGRLARVKGWSRMLTVPGAMPQKLWEMRETLEIFPVAHYLRFSWRTSKGNELGVMAANSKDVTTNTIFDAIACKFNEVDNGV